MGVLGCRMGREEGPAREKLGEIGCFCPSWGFCGSKLKGPGESTGGCRDLRSSMPRTSTLEVFSLWTGPLQRVYLDHPYFFLPIEAPSALPIPFSVFWLWTPYPRSMDGKCRNATLGRRSLHSFSLFFSTWILPWMWCWGAATARSLCES